MATKHSYTFTHWPPRPRKPLECPGCAMDWRAARKELMAASWAYFDHETMYWVTPPKGPDVAVAPRPCGEDYEAVCWAIKELRK